MFPEDYFNNISLLAIYGYGHAYKIYNNLNPIDLDHVFYINDVDSFVKSTLYSQNNVSFHIGINTNEEELNHYTCTITYKDIHYSFIFDGFIENKDDLIRKLEDKGLILHNYSNANLLGLLFLKIKGDINEKTSYLNDVIKGNYNYLIQYDDKIIAGCSHNSKKRMQIGRSDTGAIFVTNNYHYMSYLNAILEKELRDGEAILIYDNQITSYNHNDKANHICALNYLYQSNITSIIGCSKVLDIKNELISHLSKLNADIITHYPNDPLTYSYVYANTNDLTFKEIAYYHNNHILYIDNDIKDKSIIVIKEDLSQFHTLCNYIHNLYERGAREVHLKILSPMLNYNCPYYMNEKLCNHIQLNETGIKEYLNLSSLEFLTIENFMLSVKKYDKDSYICLKCMNHM